MTHSERKPATAADVDAFSIGEFCKRHGISPQLFYKFKRDMPPVFRIGTRVLVSKESAARWRTEREAANAAETSSSAPAIAGTFTP